MNIVLIGYRGTGKSTVAQLLSKQLARPVFTLDEMIVAKAGITIPQIVDRFGWDKFRDLESEIVASLKSVDGAILDCGGGVILRERNVAVLKENGKVFLLTATPETVCQRIHGDTNRPSLTAGKSFIEEVSEVLKVRTPLYQAAADHSVATDGKTAEEIVSEIVKILEK